MIEFGKTLQTARETKGYTVGQLADITKMMPSVISALENEDFHMIAAPIYGRGFVRLYCEAVGLDPKPLVDEFMEIMNGNRIPAIRERTPVEPVPAVPEPTPVPTPPEAPSAPTKAPRLDPQPDLFNPSPAPAPSAELQSVPSEPEPEPEPEPSQQPDISRYSTPFQQTRSNLPDTPPPWRLIVLALAALVVLGLVLFGIRALYRATSPRPDAEQDAAAETAAETAAEPEPKTETETAAAAENEQPAPAATADETPRTPQKIPALYID